MSPFQRALAALALVDHRAQGRTSPDRDEFLEGDEPLTFNDVLRMLERTSLFTPDLNVLECQRVRLPPCLSPSLTVSPTASPSLCLPHRLPHRLSHCVSHCVSHRVSPTVSLQLCLSLCLPLCLPLCLTHRLSSARWVALREPIRA